MTRRSEILEFIAGREAAIAGKPRDRRRNADWLRGWDQEQTERTAPATSARAPTSTLAEINS